MTWTTRRDAVTKKYETEGKPYIIGTKPLFSTLPLVASVVKSAVAADKFAYLVSEKQTLDFFAYGIGSQVDFGTGNQKATAADTNISKAKNTNGAANFVIEGLSLHCRGIRQKDGAAAGGGYVVYPTTGNPIVDAAIAGKKLVADPASIFLVPQAYSPFNLENALFQAVLGQLAMEIAWDEDRVEKIGTGFYLPQGGGGSMLRSNGQPMSSNIAKVVEGYLWAQQGEEDSELVIRATLSDDVVVPITLNDSPLTSDSAAPTVPSQVSLDVVCKLHGFEFKHPSRN